MALLRPIFARKRFDIAWSTILYAVYLAVVAVFERKPTKGRRTENALSHIWPWDQTLVALNVRSGFDLLLQACAFPAGSEILVSAVTIPDMIRLIELHGLRAIPVDLNSDASVSSDEIETLITEKTRAVLIAQLFGARKSLQAISKVCRQKDLLLIEDAAQAYCGHGFTGTAEADVSMFSFGPIKTCTALGGAVFTVRNPKTLYRMQEIQARYDQQPEGHFLRRILKHSILKALVDNPYVYGLFINILIATGKDYRAVIERLSRSLSPDDLLRQIRLRPSTALLRLQYHRLSFHDADCRAQLDKRRQRIAQLVSVIPEPLQPIGYAEQRHHFWICPIRVPRMEILIKTLFQAGFDVADGRSSLTVVPGQSMDRRTSDRGRKEVVVVVVAKRAEQMMGEVVYLPVDHDFDDKELGRLAGVLKLHYEAYGGTVTQVSCEKAEAEV